MDKLFASVGGGGSNGAAGLLGAAKSGNAEEIALSLSGADVAQNPCPCIELTFRQRVIGFASTFAIGFLISCIATTKLWTADYVAFSALYSTGNIIALFSTGFLVGAAVKRAAARAARRGA